MKLTIKSIIVGSIFVTLGIQFNSCTDKIQFGDAFLEKAPGGSVTADTVFGNPEYARQYLASIYATQYYNLPCKSSNAAPQCLNYWKGMPDALGDTHHLFYSASKVFSDYYNGALSSTPDDKNNGGFAGKSFCHPHHKRGDKRAAFIRGDTV